MNELDKAQVRHEMRDLVKDVGFVGAIECLNEMLTAAEILSEVLVEEMEESWNQGEHK